MLLFRIDNRLVHGQIIEAWLPYIQAKNLIVANDALAEDNLRQQIICLAVPEQINIHFTKISKLPELLHQYRHDKILVILENCADACLATSLDIPTPQINVGNLHFASGKSQLLPHVAVTDEEYELLKQLSKKFTLDFRAVPTEKSRGLYEL